MDPEKNIRKISKSCSNGGLIYLTHEDEIDVLSDFVQLGSTYKLNEVLTGIYCDFENQNDDRNSCFYDIPDVGRRAVPKDLEKAIKKKSARFSGRKLGYFTFHKNLQYGFRKLSVTH
ncbi:unnamed protein product [Enterobius vermicularis]|uniref:Uncharacterized protein n=1 Tax=Enterobius vermicularis TaxID=51028 RepID=A0A0N4V5J7_ENTVE|nr:unnamed protein product [Enterobius vermicularis]